MSLWRCLLLLFWVGEEQGVMGEEQGGMGAGEARPGVNWYFTLPEDF